MPSIAAAARLSPSPPSTANTVSVRTPAAWLRTPPTAPVGAASSNDRGVRRGREDQHCRQGQERDHSSGHSSNPTNQTPERVKAG